MKRWNFASTICCNVFTAFGRPRMLAGLRLRATFAALSQRHFAANHVFDDFFGVLRNVQQLARLLLLIVEDDLRCGFARFNLGAHLLDLRRLLFYRCGESLHSRF